MGKFYSFSIICECEYQKDSDDSVLVITLYSDECKPGITILNGSVEIPRSSSCFVDLMCSGAHWSKYFKVESDFEFAYIKPLKELPFTFKEIQTPLTKNK